MLVSRPGLRRSQGNQRPSVRELRTIGSLCADRPGEPKHMIAFIGWPHLLAASPSTNRSKRTAWRAGRRCTLERSSMVYTLGRALGSSVRIYRAGTVRARLDALWGVRLELKV